MGEGAFANKDLGEFFGVTCSAVRHIVWRAKGQLRVDKRYREKRDAINLQIGM